MWLYLAKFFNVINKFFSTLALCFIACSLVHAGSVDSAAVMLTDADGRYREHNCDFTNISLDVRFVPKEGRVIGKETLLFSPIQPEIDSVYLDAPGISIKKLLLDRSTANVKFDSVTGGIVVRFAKKLKWETRHSLYIQYEATPH